MLKTKLLYNGFLSEEEATSIRSSDYKFWVELKDRKTFSFREMEICLKDWNSIAEDCMMYMLVGNFLGLYTQEEKDTVVAKLAAHVKNAEPFQTVF